MVLFIVKPIYPPQYLSPMVEFFGPNSNQFVRMDKHSHTAWSEFPIHDEVIVPRCKSKQTCDVFRSQGGDAYR